MGFQTEPLEEKIMELEQKVADLQNSLKVVAEENDKISFKLTVAKESNVQSAEKIKLLDLQRKDAEYKLKDVLGAYRIMKEALEFYAENDHVAVCLEPYTVILEDSEYNWGYETGKLNRAEQALAKINER